MIHNLHIGMYPNDTSIQFLRVATVICICEVTFLQIIITMLINVVIADVIIICIYVFRR